MAKGEGLVYALPHNPGFSSLASPSTHRAASPLPIEGRISLSIFLPTLATLAHLQCKLSFSSFLLRSLRLANTGVIFQWEIYTTLRYVLYTLLLLRRATFRRNRTDLSKYLPSDTASDSYRSDYFRATETAFYKRNFPLSFSLSLSLFLIHR